MTSLSAVGSGLDIPTIVSQLVAADRAPTENRINTQGTAATAKLSALGTIKSSLSNLQSSLKSVSESLSTPAWKSTVAEGAGFTASSTSSATGGSYDLTVVSLASSHKLTSPPINATDMVGAGTLTLDIGKGDALTTLQIDVAADMSLSALAREINRVADGKGVTASIITSDSGQHLVLTSTTTGDAGEIKLTATPAAIDPDATEAPATTHLSKLNWDSATAEGLPEDQRMKEVNPPANAVVKIDGQTRTGSSNTFTDLIEGMTITLTKADESKPFNLTIAADSSIAKTNLQAFVSTYNATLNALKSSSSYDTENNKASALTGDSMVRNLQTQLRAILGGNNISDLKALGLSVAKDGVLSFSSGTFDKTSAENPSLAESVLGKSGKLTESLNRLLTSNLDSATGVLTKRTETLNQQIKKLERELDDLDVRMEKIYERYTKQFTAMDSLVASMQNTSNYLTQQLANLPSSKKS